MRKRERTERGGESAEAWVPSGGDLFCWLCGTVHLEITGAGSRIMVGLRGVVERERGVEEGYAKDAGMAGGQFVGGHETGGMVLLCGGTGNLRDWNFSGDAEAHAGALHGTKTFVRVHGVLPSAAGRAEFISNEPVAERV